MSWATTNTLYFDWNFDWNRVGTLEIQGIREPRGIRNRPSRAKVATVACVCGDPHDENWEHAEDGCTFRA